MKTLANISQFESLMNSAVNNGALYDKVQSAARAVVPPLLLSYPLVCGGLVAAGMQKHNAQEKARITQQAPKLTEGNSGDHVITDINGNMIRKYNVYDVPGERKVGVADRGKEWLVNNFRQLLFNDGGEWRSDGWHSYSEIPPVDPDDGWNHMRRTNPEEYIRCGLVSPDDGKNCYRLANPERFKAEELVNELEELEKKRDGYKQEKRKQATQDEIDEKSDELIALIVRGNLPYSTDKAEPYLKKLHEEDERRELHLRLRDIGEDSFWFDRLPNMEERRLYVEMGEKGTLPQYKPGEYFEDWYPKFKEAIAKEKGRKEPEEKTEYGPDMEPLPIDIELEQDWSGLTEEEINERLAKASKESGLMDADHIMSEFKVG